MKQPSVSLKLSPGSPRLSSHATITKMVNSSAESSSQRPRSGSGISTVPILAVHVGLRRHSFRDDLWIEEEKKRQRRLTRVAPKRATHPLEEREEVRITKISASGAKPLKAKFLLCFMFLVICFFHNFSFKSIHNTYICQVLRCVST